jgi:hypothetical protein
MAVHALPLDPLPTPGPARPKLRALQPRSRRPPLAPSEARALLEHELDVVAARCLRAVALAWDTRQLGLAGEGDHPYELEVSALCGFESGHAADRLAQARTHADAVEETARRDPDHRSPRSPLGALAAELRLPPRALDVLLIVAAPSLRGELARLYGILSNSNGRPLCDELLVTQILGAAGAERHDVAEALDPAGPLIGFGVIRVAPGKPRPFAALSVDPVVLARLRCARGPNVARRPRPLEALCLPAGLGAELLDVLSRRPHGGPVRLVVRGREGSGRRSLVAALAALAHRPLSVVDAALLPSATLVEALRHELEAAFLAGHLACVLHLDRVAGDGSPHALPLRELFRAHPAPLALALPPGAPAPLDPGHLAVELPALDESGRLAFWRSSLGRRAVRVRDVEGLAARYRITPGLIDRAVAAVPADALDATADLERTIRQGLASRLGTIAARVTRLATWSDAVLEDDVAASVRELIGRIEHRRQVYEGWGFDRVLTTARGLTALFQGGPGTGKTMVAGLIARELGLDLYRVDLSRVLSKWIGETERNLAEVFDAAEDGQAILLFDEADALFAKRTPTPESAGDRFGNVVVNYLLSRLDAFDGIAVLTTNAGGAIDPAFRRRLSYNLVFPFPDEAMRERLWRVHLPEGLPCAGRLDLRALARRYRMSGGSIRNAALRAAFLAAQARTALAQVHLEQAVELEYRDGGKLGSSGILE